MESEQIIIRAQALAHIAENEHFQAVIAEARAGYIEGIVKAHANDTDTIAHLKARLDALSEIERRLTGAVNNGKVEANKKGWRSLWSRD